MSVLRTLLRLIWLPFAFLISMCASLLLLFQLGLERVTVYLHGQSFEGDAFPVLVQTVFDAGFLLTGVTIVPALIVVIVGEVARIRSFTYYVAGGGLALAAIPLMAYGGTKLALPPPVLWQVFAAAGFAGGFVYWLLAGRSA